MGMNFRQPGNFDEMARIVIARDFPEWENAGNSLNGAVLNLGPGNKHIEGASELDLPLWDADRDEIPYGDESVKVIYAIHFLEHVRDPIRVLRECQRVLVPGGAMNIGLPYYRSHSAFKDLDHKSFWCEGTWECLFENDWYRKNHEEWKFRIGMNMITGIFERNMMLITQLVKKEG